LSESKRRQVSVFLVEDEALIRMMMTDMLEEFCHIVVAEAANIKEASALAQAPDFEIATPPKMIKNSIESGVGRAIVGDGAERQMRQVGYSQRRTEQ
jgi:CheY-like chemotaxis protein